ncbi:MAG: DNA-directed RNA polymerase subunit beta, partial [Candidatus Hodgkinia cicadicola]
MCILSPMQLFSPAVGLIPFLNHNDPTRALMAANMQKQAIPLSMPQFPLVGTGLECCIARSVCYDIVAQKAGIIISVDTIKIIVYEVIQNRYKVYLLPKFSKSNQGTCLKLKTIVYPYQIICQNEVLAECQSNDNCEISLGTNLLVTFMCWDGFNYEDSILISSTIINNGILDSFHMMDFEIKVVKTPLGIERLTNELKLISLKYYKYLPKNGIVTIGTLVREGDVLVGKLSPAIDNFTNKIDRDNNGNKFKVYMVDSSLRVPEG